MSLADFSDKGGQKRSVVSAYHRKYIFIGFILFAGSRSLSGKGGVTPGQSMSKRSPMCPIHFIEAWHIDHNKQFLYSIGSLNELPVF